MPANHQGDSPIDLDAAGPSGHGGLPPVRPDHDQGDADDAAANQDTVVDADDRFPTVAARGDDVARSDSVARLEGFVPAAAIADDVLHSVDPRYVPAERVAWWIFLLVVAAPSFMILFLGILLSWWNQTTGLIISGSWVVLIGLILAATLRWPQLTYRHTRYRVNEIGIEIRKGVLWRSIHNIPRNRVQHTDVRQGPIERRNEIATLITFTAGTSSASVELSGLKHEVALQIRDYLITEGEGDAV